MAVVVVVLVERLFLLLRHLGGLALLRCHQGGRGEGECGGSRESDIELQMR